jgi:hypothetical protein
MTTGENLTRRELIVLETLAHKGPTTVDRFVGSNELYVNSWAPTFTGLRKRGLVRRTGHTEFTRQGALAYVIEITDKGRDALSPVTEEEDAA